MGANRELQGGKKMSNEQPSPDPRLSLEETWRRLLAAKIVQYEHGGARVYYEDESGKRDLIMDLYGEGHYRDLILGLISAGAR